VRPATGAPPGRPNVKTFNEGNTAFRQFQRLRRLNGQRNNAERQTRFSDARSPHEALLNDEGNNPKREPAKRPLDTGGKLAPAPYRLSAAVRSQPIRRKGERMAFHFRLELEDGTLADPPTLQAAVPNWRPGDMIPSRTGRSASYASETTTQISRRRWSLKTRPDRPLATESPSWDLLQSFRQGYVRARSRKASDGADCLMTATTTEGGEMVPPEPSEAAGDRPVMISQRMRGVGTAQIGTWVAAGAINDEGAASVAQIERGEEDDGTLPIETTFVLVSAANTAQRIELRDRTILQPFPPPPPRRRVLVEGTWTLVSGTEEYANLRARGTRGKVYATVYDVVNAQGGVDREVTLVRDGSAEFE
jgi:hypothetical protein